jgi:NADPH:quinone reductase-like Zn-dependent oxidoreductase
MKAIRFHEHGGPEQLRYEDVPDPAPAPGEVLLQMKAAALNHLDLFCRNGIPGVKLPHIGGADGSGVVAAVGPHVDGVTVGERVLLNPALSDGSCAFCQAGEHSQCDAFQILGEQRDGTFAEYVVVPKENVARIPEGLSFVEAAAFPLVTLTAWRMLITKAQLRPGETVLILGVGGGVSSAALQIAKYAGAQVIVTSGSKAKLQRARELGADVLINHAEQDFSREVWSITEKRGVDVVLDNVGQATWPGSIRALAKGGRLVTCGASSGPKPDEDIRRIFTKQITIMGSTMGNRREFATVVALLADGKLKPLVDRTYPLAEAAAAQIALERGEQFGKMVLTIG